MSVQFGIDASSFQGNVNWARTDATTAFGWEKVTQGSPHTVSGGDVNPFLAGPPRPNKRAMGRRAPPHGLLARGRLFPSGGGRPGAAAGLLRKAGDNGRVA